MSVRTDFKNALQALTTTVVKAETAQARASDLAELRAVALAQWQRARELHAALTAELRATAPDAPIPHQTWLEQTVRRAEALFGPAPDAG